jgi:alpha-tubulin suppressor-like RCC1 family protein
MATQLTNLGVTFPDTTIQTSNYANANVANYLPTFSGNIGTANLIPGNIYANGSYGTAGQVLTSAGAGANVYWASVGGGSFNPYAPGPIGNATASTGAFTTLGVGNTITVLPNAVASFGGNVDNYLQINLQNLSNGSNAESDFVVTADNGSDTVNYINMGIVNSGYDANTPNNSLGNIISSADSYLYAQGNIGNISQKGGNLAIGTTVASKTVKIFAGGNTASNVVGTFSNTGLAVTGTVSGSNGVIVGQWTSSTRPSSATVGQVGLNTTTGTMEVYGGSTSGWTAISRNITSSGNYLFSWGGSTNGALGLGTFADLSSPMQVGLLSTWEQLVTGSFHSLAVKSDGTLWAWGRNDDGQLGLGDAVDVSSPVQVGGLANWRSVFAGTRCSFAIKTDGTLWAWGNNGTSFDGGQLGLGNFVMRSSPTQVGALTNWMEVRSYDRHTSAVKTDGTLWSWGYGPDGELGNQDTINVYSSPVQIGALTNWRQVSVNQNSAYAIKTDGTLWAWGSNAGYQLGLGNTLDKSSPVQVGALTTWSQVQGSNFYALALKTDGTLWSWGSNDSGCLGLGNQNLHASIPTQIGALADWSSLYPIMGVTSCASKVDGTLWTWGSNGNGELGISIWGIVEPATSSPVQVGWTYTWDSVAAGQTFMLGTHALP